MSDKRINLTRESLSLLLCFINRLSQISAMQDVASSSLMKGGNIQRMTGKETMISNDLSDVPTSVGEKMVSGSATGRDENVDKGTVVTFVDQSNDIQVDFKPPMISIPLEGIVREGIIEFLKRPVQIYSFPWEVTNLGFVFDPWTLFLNNQAIARKLSNFYRLRTGGLEIRVVTNGTPYLYGRYYLGYWPYYSGDSFATAFAIASPKRISSLPCFKEIDPSANSVAIMKIPEVGDRQLVLTAATAPTFGHVIGVAAAPLLNTQAAGITQYCDMTFYVSCINPDIEYNTNTKTYTETSGEYKGVLSAPLKSISKFSNTLSAIPVIGSYATSAGAAAKFGANLAEMFGYSKPPDRNPVVRNVDRTLGNITNADGLDTTTVLSLNSAALTSIDPTLLGLPPEDEMNINYITSRSALCTTFTWADDSAVNAVLKVLYVNPFTGQDGSYPCAQTPIASMANTFYYWRGSIVYRIVFCTSKFHTGRVHIAYDPNGPTAYSTDMTNTTLNWVVDLAQQTEIEIEVPYTETTLVNRTHAVGAKWGYPDSVVAFNGTLNFYVLNKLRAGSIATSVTALVYIKGGPSFELLFPTMQYQRRSTDYVGFQPSTATGAAPTNAGYDYYGTSGNVDSPVISDVVASERILSLREIGKRYMVDKLVSIPYSTAAINYICIKDFPLQPGTSVNGTAPGSTTWRLSATPFNFFNYYGPSFMCYRGGIRTKIKSIIGSSSNLIVNRSTNLLGNYMAGANVALDSAVVHRWLGNFAIGAEWATGTGTGISIGSDTGAIDSSSSAIEVTNPWTQQFNFIRVADTCNDYSLGSGLVVFSTAGNAGLKTENKYLILKAAADDFSFYFYKGPPILYEYTIA